MGMAYLQERGAGTVTGVVVADSRADAYAQILDSPQHFGHLLCVSTVWRLPPCRTVESITTDGKEERSCSIMRVRVQSSSAAPSVDSPAHFCCAGWGSTSTCSNERPPTWSIGAAGSSCSPSL